MHVSKGEVAFLPASLLPSLPSQCPYIFREKKLTISHATLHALTERPCESACGVAYELVPPKWDTPENDIHIFKCVNFGLKKDAAPVPSQKCTGHFRAQTSHLHWLWFASSRQWLTTWLPVFSGTNYKCKLIFMQNHSSQHILVYRLYS